MDFHKQREVPGGEGKSENATEEIKRLMNKILDIVLRIFFRLSQREEEEGESFSLVFYNRVIYDNWVFDMPKLLDLTAIYSHSNAPILK